MTDLATVREAVIGEIQDWVAHKIQRPDFWTKAWGQIRNRADYINRREEAQGVLGCWTDTHGPRSNENLNQVYRQALSAITEAANGPGEEAGTHALLGIMALLCAVHAHGQYLKETLHYWWDPLLTSQTLVDTAMRKRVEQLAT